MAEIEVGMPAPQFALPVSRDAKVSLSDYLGRKLVVLCFYVADFTPG